MTEVENKEAEAKLVHNRLCALIRALSNTLSARDPTSFLPKVARQYLESIGEGVPPPPQIFIETPPESFIGGEPIGEPSKSREQMGGEKHDVRVMFVGYAPENSDQEDGCILPDLEMMGMDLSSAPCADTDACPDESDTDLPEPVDDPDDFSDVNRLAVLSPTELLESVVRTACENDSQGVADYADALRYLASVGRCRIIVDAGDLVRVEWLG